MILKFEDDNTRLTPWTVVKFKMADGTILRLEGCDVNYEVSSSGRAFMGGGLGFSSSNSFTTHYVRFKMSKEQIEILNQDVVKLIINTLPEIYSFNYKGKGKIGEVLYSDFANLKDEMDN